MPYLEICPIVGCQPSLKIMDIAEKCQKIVSNNTYYFINPEFEIEYQKYIDDLISKVVELQLAIEKHGCSEKLIGDFIEKDDDGLLLISTLTTLSFEVLEGVITCIVTKNNKKLEDFFNTNKWNKKNQSSRWGIDKIKKTIRKNKYFKECIVNIFFHVHNIPEFKDILPLFELNKFKPSKLYNIHTLVPDFIDSLLRAHVKGSYVARKERNAEILIESVLNKLNIPYTRGDLPIFAENENTRKRTLDFIIPNKKNPMLIIECSYVSTTSSGLGDKAKAEIGVSDLMKKYYPNTKFIGFLDGVGWMHRNKDLERICEAFDNVYTFKDTEIESFVELLKKIVPEYFEND